MDVKEIEEEMKRLETRLALLKKNLIEIQQNCDHQFIGNPIFEVCAKCRKVNILYY